MCWPCPGHASTGSDAARILSSSLREGSAVASTGRGSLDDGSGGSGGSGHQRGGSETSKELSVFERLQVRVISRFFCFFSACCLLFFQEGVLTFFHSDGCSCVFASSGDMMSCLPLNVLVPFDSVLSTRTYGYFLRCCTRTPCSRMFGGNLYPPVGDESAIFTTVHLSADCTRALDQILPRRSDGVDFHSTTRRAL